MELQRWTVVRFPAGGWSYGGKPSEPDYAESEVYLIWAKSGEEATKKAQGIRARLKKKGESLPTQSNPYKMEYRP